MYYQNRAGRQGDVFENAHVQLVFSNMNLNIVHKTNESRDLGRRL